MKNSPAQTAQTTPDALADMNKKLNACNAKLITTQADIHNLTEERKLLKRQEIALMNRKLAIEDMIGITEKAKKAEQEAAEAAAQAVEDELKDSIDNEVDDENETP